VDLDSAWTHFALYQGKAYFRTSKSNSPSQPALKCVLVVKGKDNVCDGSVQALPPALRNWSRHLLLNDRCFNGQGIMRFSLKKKKGNKGQKVNIIWKSFANKSPHNIQLRIPVSKSSLILSTLPPHMCVPPYTHPHVGTHTIIKELWKTGQMDFN